MGKQIFLILGLALALGACNKGSGSTANIDTPGVVSAVPDMNQCNPSIGSNSVPAGYGNWRIRPYSRHSRQFHNHHSATYEIPNDGLCDCPLGMMPTCSPQGLMCVPMNSITSAPVVMWAWVSGYSDGQTSYSYSRSGYYSYSSGSAFGSYPSVHSNQPSCANSVALSCATPGQINGDLYCRAVAPGSPYGVWTSR